MKTKCYSVKLQSFSRISDKCYKALAFDGSEALIPASQYFGQDYEGSSKSDAYWISCWILEKKELQYSTKKAAWYDPETDRFRPHFDIIVEKHIPEKITPNETSPDRSLIR